MAKNPRIDPDRAKHWLVRRSTIRLLWYIFSGVLALTVVAGLFVDFHPHFGIEDSFGFFAWFGLLTCAAMVVFAKVLGVLIKRPEDYYDGE